MHRFFNCLCWTVRWKSMCENNSSSAPKNKTLETLRSITNAQIQEMTKWLLQEHQQCSKGARWIRQLDFIRCSQWKRSLDCISKSNSNLFQDLPLSKIMYPSSSDISYIVKNILSAILAGKKVTALVFPWSVTFIHCMRICWR